MLIDDETGFILDRGAKESDTAVIFVLGVGGKAFGDGDEPLSAECLARGLDFLRIQSWDSVKELEQKSIKQIQADVVRALEFLKANGYRKIFAIGKSFGGGLLLTRDYPEIAKMVLWAPAIGAAGGRGNLDEKVDVTLSEVESLLDITVGKDLISTIEIPVRIIHGTEDEAIPIENSLALAKFLPHSDIVKISGLGHTAETQAQKKELIDATLDFLDLD